jgi:hypothetical protein
MAKGGRKSKRGKKTVKVTISQGKLTPTSKVKLKRKFHDPSPDEETAAGVPPNAERKRRKKNLRKKGATKAAAGTAGFRVIGGGGGAKRGGDSVKPSGLKPKKLKSLVKKLKKKKSTAGMTVVGGS